MGRLATALAREVEAFCTSEGRMVGSAGHDVARRLLVGRCEALGLSPYGAALELPYETPDIRGTNIIGVRRGSDRTLAPLLMAAHYDSVIAAPCADDNAAAVAILLALAEQLESGVLDRDVVFAFFDAEEPPYFQSSAMGSIRFVEDQMDERGTHAAVVLDLMGHDVPIDVLGKLPFRVPGLGKLKDLFFLMGAESHEALAGAVEAASLPKRLRMIATRNANVGDLSDHHAFRLRGVPFLFLSCGRWPHYHEPTDTPEKLNYKKMARFTEWLGRLVPGLTSADLNPTQTGPYEVDTVDFEIESLKKSLGLLYPIALRLAGLPKLETREHLDDLAGRLLQLGL